jgi:hypothetical protein
MTSMAEIEATITQLPEAEARQLASGCKIIFIRSGISKLHLIWQQANWISSFNESKHQ